VDQGMMGAWAGSAGPRKARWIVGMIKDHGDRERSGHMYDAFHFTLHGMIMGSSFHRISTIPSGIGGVLRNMGVGNWENSMHLQAPEILVLQQRL